MKKIFVLIFTLISFNCFLSSLNFSFSGIKTAVSLLIKKQDYINEKIIVKIATSFQNKIIEIFNKIVKDYEVILLSDYGKGVLTSQLTQSLINIAKKYNKKDLGINDIDESKSDEKIDYLLNDKEYSSEDFLTRDEKSVKGISKEETRSIDDIPEFFRDKEQDSEKEKE